VATDIVQQKVDLLILAHSLTETVVDSTVVVKAEGIQFNVVEGGLQQFAGCSGVVASLW